MSEETPQDPSVEGPEGSPSESLERSEGSAGMALSEAQLSAIAATVAAAVKAVQPESQPRETPVTGRGPWDTLSELITRLFELLGKNVIYLVVMALLGIGWYFVEEQKSDKEKFLTEQQNEQEKFFTEQLQELEKQRNQAFGLVQTAYKDITDVGANQITNLDKALALLTTITDEVDKNQQEGFKQKLDTYKTQQELEQLRAQVKLAEEEIGKKELAFQKAKEQAEVNQREAEKEIEHARAELNEEKVKLERQATTLIQRAGTIGEFQDILRTLNEATEKDLAAISDTAEGARADLALALEELKAKLETSLPAGVPTDIDNTLNELRALTTDLSALGDREQYSAWSLTQSTVRDFIVDPAQILRPFASFDSTLESNALDRLVGVSEQKVVASIQQAKGLDFDFWVSMTTLDPDATDAALMGFRMGQMGLVRGVVLEIGRSEFRSTIAVESSGANSDEKRITETESFLGVGPAFVPDKSDWLEFRTLLVDVGSDGEIDVSFESGIRPDTDESISLKTLLDDEDVSIEPIWGTPQPFKLLTRDQLYVLFRDTNLPSVTRKRLQDPFEAPRINFDMIERADDPDAILAGADLYRIVLTELRTTVDMLIRSAIAKDIASVQETLVDSYIQPLPRWVVGQLGAFALRPQFRVARSSVVQAEHGYFTPFIFSQTLQEQTLSELQPEEAVDPDTLDQHVEVTLAATTSADGEEAFLSLVFARSPADKKWRLVDVVEGSLKRDFTLE